MSNMASTGDAASVPAEEQKTLDLVHKLLQSFQDGSSSMAFACGGTIPIPLASNAPQQSSTISDRARACQPVILRWDPSSESVPASKCKIQFPLDQSDSKTVHNIQQLLHDMQPATFGHQGQNVLGESCHKAYELEPSDFACTFNPHELGIVDDIARVLLPGFKDQTTSKDKLDSVCGPPEENVERELVMRAELYRLNVHAGPSGRFKTHFDAPRSTKQIGSLVVCLPSVHEGGQLEVRHEGRTATFDWSFPEIARSEIQWAAFYSDCEHEFLPVTSGHLITLTYNLYVSSGTGCPGVGRGLIDATQLPLHDILHELLSQENFMPDGGYLGVHTSHAYSHTSGSSGPPPTLKGADMVAWETLRTLGCDVRLRPVVELPGWAHYGHQDLDPGWAQYGLQDLESCQAGDLTDTSSEGSDSHTDGEPLIITTSESGHEETQPDKVGPSQVGGGGDLPMSDGERCSFKVEPPMSPQTGHGNPTAEANNMTDPGKDDGGDSPMADGLQVPHAPSDLGPWEVDEEEVQALQKENEELQSLPSTHFTGIKPACLLLPRSEDDEDDEATAARFEQHGVRTGCLALGNGLPFHAETNLVEGGVEMTQILGRWIEQKPQGQERTTQQPARVRYEEVAWLNHSGMSKKPQVSYAVVSCLLWRSFFFNSTLTVFLFSSAT